MPITAPPSGASVAPPGSDPNWAKWISPNAWEVALLEGIGAPIDHTTVTAIDAWAASEGTAWANNPLAISGINPGAVKCIAQCGSSSPIMQYNNMSNGVAATVAFLLNNNYSTLVQNFRLATFQAEQADNASKLEPGGPGAAASGLLSDIWASINASGWCRGCQGGHYPAVLLDVINGSPLSSSQLKSAAAGVTAAFAATSPAKTATASQQGAAQSGVGPFATLIPGLGTVISDLTSASFWERVGLFALGLLLAGVGLAVFLANTAGRELKANPELAAVAAA